MIKSVFLHEFKKAGAVTLDVYVLWYKTLNLWNMDTDEIIHFQSIEEAFEYEIKGKAIKDIIAEADMSLFDMVLDGGSGSGSPKGNFKFGHAARNRGDGGFIGNDDLPARMNTKIKNKTEHDAIQAFRKQHNSSNIEHGMTVDRSGFVNGYNHGAATSVAFPKYNKGDLMVHNHPSGGHFSDTDLLSMSRTSVRGVVATNPKGYYKVEKGTHFQGEKFARAVKNANMTGTSYDNAVDRWLKQNQKKYGYKYTNYKDAGSKKTKAPAPKVVFDASGQGSLF